MQYIHSYCLHTCLYTVSKLQLSVHDMYLLLLAYSMHIAI